MRSLPLDDRRSGGAFSVLHRPLPSEAAEPESARAPSVDILSLVAHELRNGLLPLRLAAAQIDAARVDAKRLTRLRFTIEQQVDHLSGLIGDLLDVSRARNGKLRLACRPLDVATILARCVADCRPRMAAHAQHLEVRVPAGPLPLSGDPERLVQVFDNLLDNACKYTPPGGRIVLCAALMPDGVEVSVCDDGIGIAAEALGRVFEPFVQVDTAVGFNGAGLGIGLSVVRELVQAHGGQVIARSAGPGLGSCFTITLPFAGPPRTVAQEESR
ncbi:sensor histidine kinase [Aquabacterium humicola]|uniref:sensor histidine kinase n=1 Tax=Aquabacterium humicola TaxID=3237377 RepID=UPI00254352B5|nr:HAMP domain-containing sensor histidine kinase [Rubrivivax pictus]